MSTDVEILYEVGPCYVLNKPAGLLTQAPAHIDSLERRMKALLRDRENKTGEIYLGVPHRLDRPVTGALVVTRHVRAARRLAEQFEARTVKKTYWALVEGSLPEPAGEWSDFVRKIPDVPKAEIVPQEHPDAREAILSYLTLETFPSATLVEVELQTGRMHQIRLQFATRGHPVVGDALYGAGLPFGEQFEDERERAIALHARSLAFRHPMDHAPVSVTAPLPDAWRTFGVLD